MKKINRIALFLIFTFTISFSSAGIYKLLGGGNAGTIGFTIFGASYMFIPAISVFLVKKIIYKEKISSDLLISFNINKWFLVAWLIMPLIIFLTVCINLLFPNVSYNPEMTGFIDRFKDILTPDQIEQMKISLESLPINIIWLTLIQGLIAGISINAIAAFGEELGWRGFLVHAFKNMHFVKASLLIGLIWGFWHAPMILMGHNYPQHPQVGILMMTILCILLTPILMYITLKSKSVIAAAITHGTMNAVAGISIMAIKGGNDLTSGIAGLAGFLALIVCILVLFMLDYFIVKDKIFLNKIDQHLI